MDERGWKGSVDADEEVHEYEKSGVRGEMKRKTV